MNDHTVDLVYQLLDRQIVDSEGLLVGKVDDLELEVVDGPTPDVRVTALLLGSAVLVPRLAGRLERRFVRYWRRLGEQDATRMRPSRIGLDLVREIGSHLTLSARREGVAEMAAEPRPTLHTLGEMLEFDVVGGGAHRRARVLDVRARRPGAAAPESLQVTGLIVGPARPGAFLGYDRQPGRGPWPVARVAEWLLRHSRGLDLSEVGRIDWAEGRILLRGR